MVGMNSEKMRKEAVKRMYRLGLNFSVIDDFEYGRLRCSDHDKMTDVPEEILKEIAEWERKFHNIVYHVIHGDFGYETYECLSVSNYGYVNFSVFEKFCKIILTDMKEVNKWIKER